MGEVRLTFFQHLEELRKRLWRAVLAVLALGALSLVYAREIFQFLMRPVLAALPEGSRSLVYTSGIEELNVLLKVGLYAGLFLGMPVLLYQVWGFIAPGLYKNERRVVAPFVLLGTGFFTAGAVFCYLAVLPTMFKFLLRPSESAAIHARLIVAKGRSDDATRMVVLGRSDLALELVQAGRAGLAAPGEGQMAPASTFGTAAEVRQRLDRLSSRLDLLTPKIEGPEGSAALLAALKARSEAERLLSAEQPREATVKADEALSRLADADPSWAEGLKAVWSLDRDVAAGSARLEAEEWTKPMLTMREQLGLVLLLEVAFGVIFELPLVMALLALLGLVKASFLAKYQRHAIVACVTLAAIITPSGDAVNLALMAVPMIVCYELGVLLAWLIGKRRESRETEEALVPSK